MNIEIKSLERFIKTLEENTDKALERGVKVNEQYTENDKYIYKDLFGKWK